MEDVVNEVTANEVMRRLTENLSMRVNQCLRHGTKKI